MSGDAATARERGVSLSACILWGWRQNTGSDCTNHDYPPTHSAGTLRWSDTGSPNTHCLCPTRSPRTRVPGRRPPVVDRRLAIQERWQKSCGSSSTSMLDADNNTEQPVSIRRRRQKHFGSSRDRDSPSLSSGRTKSEQDHYATVALAGSKKLHAPIRDCTASFQCCQRHAFAPAGAIRAVARN
jgi:hypothetical protein